MATCNTVCKLSFFNSSAHYLEHCVLIILLPAENCIYFLSDESKKAEVAHCVLVKFPCSDWEYISSARTSAVPYMSPLSKLVFPLCWSISLHDDQRYISHIQASFLYWLWQGQTLNGESLMSQLKKWKHKHLHERGPKVTPQRCCWVSGWVQGALPGPWEEGGPLGAFLQTPRSCWQECVNFKFQVRIFFLSDSLKNVPFFCAFVSVWVHRVTPGQRVKHVIHQNKINNERVFLLESAGEKKNVCCQLACGDSKHSRAGAGVWTCHYLPQLWQRLLAAGLWLATLCLPGNESEKRLDWEGTQPQLNKNWEWSLQRDAVWEGVQSYCTAPPPLPSPPPSGSNTGVNALRISSNTHLLILRGM